MTQISPLLSNKLNQLVKSPTKFGTTDNAKVDLTTKPDSISLSKNNFDKKKVLKYGAIGVAFLGLAAGVAALIKKGKVPPEILSVQKSANEMEKEALSLAEGVQKAVDDEIKPMQESAEKLVEEIKDRAEKIKSEVVELFNNGGKNKEGTQVATISKNDNLSLMAEFDSEGKPVRISGFNEYGYIKHFQESSDNGVKIYKFSITGDIQAYQDGAEHLPDGTHKATNGFSFLDNDTCVYSQGIEQLEDGTKKSAKMLITKDGEIVEYAKDAVDLPDFNQKTAKSFIYRDGALSEYIEDFEKLSDDSEKTAKVLTFYNGQVSNYNKSGERIQGQSNKYAQYMDFEDGNVVEYMEDFEDRADDTIKYAKNLSFIDGEPASYVEGFEAMADGDMKIAKSLTKEGSKWVEKH